MGKRKDFRWRYQPPSNSSAAVLLSYIQEHELHPTVSRREMIMNALTAYYLPLAYSVFGRDREKLERAAYDSIFALLRQIDRLITELDLERSKLSIYAANLIHTPSENLQTNQIPEQQLNPVVNSNHQGENNNHQDKFNLNGLSGFRTSYQDD